MRGATQCARRLKPLIRSLRTKLGKVSRPSTGDPIKQMILGIFSRDVPESKAVDALDQLRGLVVDYNELRVVPPIEMTEMVGTLPHARIKCEDLSRALNKVFSHEHEVTLDRLASLPKKEVVAYLDDVDGLDPYSRARIRLLGLQQHAIPLNEATWAYARKTEIVDPRCPLEEAQAFLERKIPEAEALEFVALMEKQAWSEVGAAVRNGDVEHISSVPPDRTARNMLQLVTTGREAAEPDEAEAGPDADQGTDSDASEPATRSTATAAAAKNKARKPRRSRGTPKTKAAARSKPVSARAAKAKKKKKAAKKRQRKTSKSAKSKPKKTARTKSSRPTRRSAAKVKSA